ncbi:MAG: hypothetical protein B6I36_09715 [Desulfobacteraceae bacterium 4572_35.1]|nr:MAG: hypothetical protein B6I36_09715 [Desulfobacteraceae bacterium 4572_35.1]
MRLLLILMSGVMLVLSGCNCDSENNVAPKNGTTKLETLNQRVSYSVGYDIGDNFKKNDFELDLDLVAEGLSDAKSGATPRLDQKKMGVTMQEFQQYMMEHQQKKIAEVAEKNSAAGKIFLEENSAKEGVVTLASGLQYKVLTAGTGEKPTKEDVVQVDYRGTLIDGTQFDSSYDRGKPVEFPVSRVIAGWTEALQLMPVGSKWQLFIPSELAYGSQGMGSVIEPNSVLIFDVELLKLINPQAEQDGKETTAHK